MAFSRHRFSRAGKKLSPASNRAAKVRPVVSSLLCICVRFAYVSSGRSRLIAPARCPERGADLLAVGPAGQQDVQEQPGLKRVEEPGADQAAPEQVLLGAREAIGGGQHRSSACPGCQDHRDLPGEGVKGGNRRGRNVPGAERGHDEAVEPARGCLQQLAVVAEGYGDQAGAHLPGKGRCRRREPPGRSGEEADLSFDDPAERSSRW